MAASERKLSTDVANSGSVMRNGDRMKQREFHHAYAQMPEEYRAELLDGIVYIEEPHSRDHTKIRSLLASVFQAYTARTPGVETQEHAKVILSNEDQVQPDLFIRILPKFGGQTSNNEEHPPSVNGPPELIAEIAYSSRSIDLHLKKARYTKAKVTEYIVISLDPMRITWFDLQKQDQLECDEDKVYRSRVFPGLWIDARALLDINYVGIINLLAQGLRSEEHQQFSEHVNAAQR